MRHFLEVVYPCDLAAILTEWDTAGIKLVSCVQGGVPTKVITGNVAKRQHELGQYSHVAYTLIGMGDDPNPTRPAPESIPEPLDLAAAARALPSSPVGRGKGKK